MPFQKYRAAQVRYTRPLESFVRFERANRHPVMIIALGVVNALDRPERIAVYWDAENNLLGLHPAAEDGDSLAVNYGTSSTRVYMTKPIRAFDIPVEFGKRYIATQTTETPRIVIKIC